MIKYICRNFENLVGEFVSVDRVIADFCIIFNKKNTNLIMAANIEKKMTIYLLISRILSITKEIIEAIWHRITQIKYRYLFAEMKCLRRDITFKK